jgi:manganese/zinc/iron transport system ATP- binding protein
MNKPAVEIRDLMAGYAGKPVLWGINADIPSRQLTCIIGPNGAGKSTLLKAILNLVDHQARILKILGKSLEEVRHKISYVPQRETVDWDFPATAYDVVLMGRYAKMGLFSRPSKADKFLALEALEKVGMHNFADRQIRQLSGGQQQRVFLARSLAQQAELYFLDEPFAGVDAATEKTILGLLQEMTREGKTIIAVHHDLNSAGTYFNHALLLNMRLIAQGPIEEVLSSQNLQATYGAKLTVLSDVSDIVKKMPAKSQPFKK